MLRKKVCVLLELITEVYELVYAIVFISFMFQETGMKKVHFQESAEDSGKTE